jgi:HSP20 family protein
VERRYGAFVRTLTLPAPVEADKVEAKVRFGVLSIRLAKKESARAHRVEVKAD